MIITYKEDRQQVFPNLSNQQSKPRNIQFKIIKKLRKPANIHIYYGDF